MPTATQLAQEHGVSRRVFAYAIPQCLGFSTPHGRYSYDETIQAREHFTTHTIHAPRRGTEVAGEDLGRTFPVTIGADPEFALSRNGQLVPAREVLRGGTWEQLGTDGASSTGEMRPSFGTAQDCFNSVDSLMTRLATTIASRPDGIDVHAGAFAQNLSLGGHIHIGGRGHSLDASVIRAMDQFIAQPLNSVADVAGRQRRGYGSMSETRNQAHGVEYRSAPSWLAHPVLTLGALTIAEVLARRQRVPANMTWEKLTELCNTGGEVVAVEAFKMKIEELTRMGTRLESVEVLRAWGKRRPQPVRRPRQVRARTVRVTVSAADALPAETYNSDVTSGPTQVQGASSRRDFTPGESVVYVPMGMYRSGMTVTSSPDVSVRQWERMEIGLSLGLRERFRYASDDRRAIIEEVRRAIG